MINKTMSVRRLIRLPSTRKLGRSNGTGRGARSDSTTASVIAAPSGRPAACEDPDLDGCIGTTACADQHGRRPAMAYVSRQPISGVPWIRSSSCSLTGCVLATRVACLAYGHHV